jgi:hypothetical protein
MVMTTIQLSRSPLRWRGLWSWVLACCFLVPALEAQPRVGIIDLKAVIKG